MDKYTYLHELNQSLSALTPQERSQVMKDAEAKFDQAEETGRPISEVIDELGLPKSTSLVKEPQRIYKTPEPVAQRTTPNQPITMILIIIGLLLFNTIIVLGPFVGTWGVILGFFISGIALTISGILIVLSGILAFPISFISIPLIVMSHPVLLFSTGFFLLGLGGLLSLLTIYIGRFLGILTYRYAKWNIKVIRGY
jgi:uncharacterized membrane protein